MFKSIFAKVEEKKAALVRRACMAINNKQGAADLLTVVVLCAGSIILAFLFLSALKTETAAMTKQLSDKIKEIFAFSLNG